LRHVAFFSLFRSVWDKSTEITRRLGATGGRRAREKEGQIDQNRHASGDGRAATLTLSHGFRRLGRFAVVVAALVLIALTWVGVRDAIRAHRTEAQARVQAEVLGKALAFEEQVRRELLSLEQTLRILEYEWQRDPANFDLAARAGQVVVLNDVSLQLFITDVQGIVRFSTRPAIIGTDVSGRDYFRHEASLPAGEGKMFIGSLTQGQVTHLWQFNLVRRLNHPDGSFAGVIAASYDANALARYYREAGLGMHGMIAVVSEPDGDAWTLSDPTQSPTVVNIANTPMFAAMQTASEGNWQGIFGPDSNDRLYAFATVPDRGLRVVAGVDRAEAMSASVVWERNAVIFASGTTLLVLLMAALLLREENAARRRHEALARERTILQAALTGMSDGIMMVDGDLRLLAWNQHFPEFTGVPADILRVGLPMEDILRSQVSAGEFGPVDIEAEVARRMVLLRAGATMGTLERPRPTGRQLEIRRNSLPGGGFVTLYTDVTARHQTEERLRQAQTMAAVGRLTSGVAHDFNNLLVSISGNAEMLHNQLAEHPTHARRLAVILQAAGRGADLVRQLLAFSRKQTLEPVKVDLNEVVRGISDLLRATLGRMIRVETKLAADLWPALIDPVQIEHVILNLTINARDAMPQGGTLTIATANTILGPHGRAADLPPGEYVVVSVTDTGTGMNDEVLRNAFEPFFTTKPPGQGSGLGLSQVYGVASQSGGGVQIDSALGRGTTVNVLFPRAVMDATTDADDGSHADGAPEADASLSTSGRIFGTILVVDDEADCRETVAAMLSANGFAVAMADSGHEALRLMELGLDFDLLLVDFTMPVMNGVELAQAVRARRASIPVVFFTGGEGERIAGERWVLMKPFLTRTLTETLRAALGLAQDPDAARRKTSQAV
jgi:signal transduction histidine kinase/CheY-like chemotaxis protein